MRGLDEVVKLRLMDGEAKIVRRLDLLAAEQGELFLDAAAILSLRVLFGDAKAAAMFGAMLAKISKLLDEARRALSAGDLAEAKRIGHGVRGMAGTWGACAIAEEGRRLEREVRDLCDAAEALERLTVLIGRARDEFSLTISSRPIPTAKENAA